jgi:beta-lactamase class A
MAMLAAAAGGAPETADAAAPRRASTASASTCANNPFWSGFDAALRARWPGRRITAAVYDERTGCQHRYRSGERVTTASVLKIDIMAGVLLRAQRAGRALTATERSRIAAMIRTSDDPSANALWSSLGGTPAMASLAQELGLDETRAAAPWGLSSTSAADRNELLRQLVLGQWGPFRAATRAEARRFLLDVVPSQRWGVTAGVPSGWPVPLKNGFFPATCCGWRVNSSGVVERPDGSAYVVTVLSDGWASLAQGIAAVEFVSASVAAWNRVAVGPHRSAARFAREARRDVLGSGPSHPAEQTIADRIGSDPRRAGAEVVTLLGQPATDASSGLVLRLHLALLGRLPSPGTWSGRVTQLRTGTRTPLQVAEALASAPELGGGVLDAGGFVELVYQRAFGRRPSPSELAWWTARLGDGRPRGELLVHAANSNTARWITGRSVQVAGTYLSLLRRNPTPQERSEAEAALWAGEALQDLAWKLVSSPSYATRFG